MNLVLPILIATICAGIGYANPAVHFPAAALGFPLALGLVAFSARSPREALKRGWIVGSFACLACLYWLAYPVGVYGGISWFLAIPCPILMAMAVGGYYGLYTFILNIAARKLHPFMLCIFSGLLWTTMEFAQGYFFTGFPWMTLSSAFSFWPESIQGAAFVGAYGLSGLLASITTGLLTWKSSNLAKIWSVGILTAIVLLGVLRTQPETFSTLRSIGNATIGVVQGNIDQGSKWDSKYQIATLDKYIKLSKNFAVKPDLIVWPETAMPFQIQDPSDMRATLLNFSKDSGTPLLTGAPGYVLHPQSKSYSLYNRALLLDPHKTTLDWYEKSHLVPFGEYVPLKEYLPIDKLVQGIGDFIPGKDASPLQSGNLAMGILICYEGIFPELAQERVEKGANLLINISNDAWYGKTSAPFQHLGLVSLRAVEQGRYLIRGTNTGISACIDPLGKVSDSTGLFVDAAILTTPELMTGMTFFSSNYELMTYGPLFLTLLFVIWIAIAHLVSGNKRKY
ncbi:apolipoprotein N-acyltransferase [Maridesulfovibrio ferrireducens]|uniref:apolipoprotein N-acyltransferase n=1 Tax=Maridesulfovibrio ferrireducens TaxID=246191 RepID=UPI001A2B66A9|nr:apolipoprotein N-acyltransferase [Maridesulfovibrio ferrireducens]MBI9110450.1 apolipoprotein N-acyltransferase [Maridesulfovibrio ferrireducens]